MAGTHQGQEARYLMFTPLEVSAIAFDGVTIAQELPFDTRDPCRLHNVHARLQQSEGWNKLCRVRDLRWDGSAGLYIVLFQFTAKVSDIERVYSRVEPVRQDDIADNIKTIRVIEIEQCCRHWRTF